MEDSIYEELSEMLDAMGQTKQTFYETFTRTALRERRENLRDICEIFTVAYASQNEILDAIDKNSFSDFEDCLQDKCAKEVGADYIITCNTKDFEASEVAAVNPKEFLKFIACFTNLIV